MVKRHSNGQHASLRPADDPPRSPAVPPALVPPPQDDPAKLLESIGIPLIPMPEFLELAEIVSSHFGIKVTKNKLTLATSRIYPIITRRGFADYRRYLDALKADGTGELLSELASHISTNHTDFFRESAHFKLLSLTILPELITAKRRAGNRDIRVWCAACSTGEEAYTLQFCLMRSLGGDYPNWKAGLLATDISANALAAARAGVYSLQKMSAVPLDMQRDFFRGLDSEHCEVIPEVRKEITFRRLNLMNRSYPLKKQFDIIFCRNVMIYFDRSEHFGLVRRLHDWLEPGGYLFIGHSESVSGYNRLFQYVAPSVYMRRKD